jgi:Putative Flp pilus-assembly TadE/G-like
MPVLIGVAALGTEGAQVLTLHRQAQAAADSAAVSVASYYGWQKTVNPLATPSLSNLTGEAQAVVATYPGVSGATVTVHNPPLSGNFTNSTTYPYAFEVIVSQSHSPLLSSYWLPNGMTVTARAVALINATTNGSGGGSSADCILALGDSSGGSTNLASAITANGNARLNLQGAASEPIRAQTEAGPPMRSISVRKARPRSI